ncbi:hypothetical protein DXM27_05440 [Rhizobium rhizogenes]|uniref:Uncharacterized protein n=1 Tax=Rhizobium rhizogenes TaxID=359 RepID=A0AA88F2C1_RHIRH|nr:hypothetical protein DXM27_05440 [Rhizobium rhizogenes]
MGAKNDAITGKTAGGFRGASIRQSCPMTGLRLKRRHRPIRFYLIARWAAFAATVRKFVGFKRPDIKTGGYRCETRRIKF